MRLQLSSQWRAAVLAVASCLLLSACSGGDDGGSASGSSPIPTGLAGSSAKSTHKASGHGSKSAKPSGRTTSRSRSRSASATRAASTSASATRASSSSRPAPRTTTTRRTTSAPPPPPSGPTITVTPHTGLAAEQTVTVAGSGFKPNETLIVVECQDKGENTSLAVCNINNLVTFAPAKRVTSDANGKVGPVQIVVRKQFKSVNCGQVTCLVSVAVPSAEDHSEEADVHLRFA